MAALLAQKTDRLNSLIDKVPGWDPARGRITPLKGGITNQNYRVRSGGGDFVLRINGRGGTDLGIDRGREHSCARTAAELGIGPQVLGYFPRQGALLTRFIAGKPISRAKASKPQTLRRIARAVKRCHEGPDFPGRFSPFETVRRYQVRAFGSRSLAAVRPSLARVWPLMDSIEKALGPPRGLRPCHNDLLAGNLIDDGSRIRILDWEYAAMGDPFFDLGNFAANQRLNAEGCRLLLADYLGESSPRALARLNLYRLSSDLREAFWGFLQATISDIKFDFSGYGSRHLERFLRAAASRHYETWLREAP